MLPLDHAGAQPQRVRRDATTPTSRTRSPALARFRVNALRDRKGPAAVFRVIPAQDRHRRGAGDHRRSAAALLPHQGARARHRPDRLGQVDDALRADRPRQPDAHRPHHHDRGPDRVRAREQEVPHHAAPGGRAHRARSRARCARRCARIPDIVLVGEMRDLETIAIAIETAETGHLVFGTLHTTTAAEHGRPHHRPVPGRPAGADPRDALRVAARA